MWHARLQLIIGFIFVKSILLLLFFAEKREKEKLEKAERQRQHELEKAEKAKKAAYALEQQEKAELQQRYTIGRKQKNRSNHIDYWLNSCNFTIFFFLLGWNVKN